MATGPETETAYENPLIPNARLKQMYRAMLQARLLGERLAKGRSRSSGTLKLEACLVSPSVDLGPGDLVSDGVVGGVVEFLRGAPLETVLEPGTVAKKRSVRADCGAAAALPDWGVQDRLQLAMGAAAGLQALASRDKDKPAGVAVVYVRQGEFAPGTWRPVLALAGKRHPPVLFVVLSAAGAGKTAKAGALSALALRHGVPGMAVDADDAVAIYRVAQEALGRARSGGGAALLECVPWVVEGARGNKAAHADALVGLEQYMVSRGVATSKWMEQEAKSFAERMAR